MTQKDIGKITEKLSKDLSLGEEHARETHILALAIGEIYKAAHLPKKYANRLYNLKMEKRFYKPN